MTPSTSAMHREIHEIPDVVARLLNDSEGEIETISAAIREARPRWIMLAGRGTSDHAAVYAQYLFETFLGLPTGLVKPSVTTVYQASLAWSDGLVIAVSQSGRSPDVVAVVTEARRGGALTLAITNTPASPVAAAAAMQIDCRAGPELAVPATKTYVAELVALASLTAALHGGDELRSALSAMPDVLAGAIDQTETWLNGLGAPIVAELAGADRALVVSRGYNLATALELSLKLKETCGVFADAYSTADFAHGPLVLATPDVPTVAIRPDGHVGRQVDTTVAVIAARGGPATVIGGAELAGRDRALAIMAGLPEALTPVVYVVPGQLLVEATAVRRGVNPDAPIGIEKVTLTR